MDLKGLLTDADCVEILQNSTRRTDLHLTSHSIRSLPGDVQGFIGSHFSVIIKYKDESGVLQARSFFLKVLNKASGVIFEFASSLDAYEKEEFFYTFLMKEFASLELDVTFAPEGYLCKPHLIVLEDLANRGFKTRDKKLCFDLQHCKAALGTLAKFHSTAWIYQESFKSPFWTWHEKYGHKLKDALVSGDNRYTEMTKCTTKSLLELLDTIPEFGADFQDKIRKETSLRTIKLKNLSRHKQCLLHADVWSNNFLFSYNGERVRNCKLIDYQFLKCGPPALDVVQLILSNTRRQFRDEHYEEMLDFYHESLAECLIKSHLDLEDILPRKVFLLVCEEVKVLVKLLVLEDRSITNLPQEILVENLQTEDALRSLLYEDRCKLVLETFNNVAFYKELILEDLFELQDML